jgi:hypothetical protein
MYSACGNAALPALGFPIRESPGQRLFNASPGLIAVVHALHRLLVPRHPPCALTILTVIGPDPRVRTGDTRIDLANYAVFKVRRAQPRRRPVSQNSTACVLMPRAARPRAFRLSPKSGRHARWPDVHADAGTALEELPRKEVIQPQLPLRLPCYDFTPITSPTFDGSLPKG